MCLAPRRPGSSSDSSYAVAVLIPGSTSILAVAQLVRSPYQEALATFRPHCGLVLGLVWWWRSCLARAERRALPQTLTADWMAAAGPFPLPTNQLPPGRVFRGHDRRSHRLGLRGRSGWVGACSPVAIWGCRSAFRSFCWPVLRLLVFVSAGPTCVC